MTPIDPLPLAHSWPLFEERQRFDLGLDFAAADLRVERPGIVPIGLGQWECDLADNSLRWSGAVYDLFGLPRGAKVWREETVALYAERSRAVMERLRAHAIRHRRGFTLDAEIVPMRGPRRWMRLVAAPEVVDDRVVRLRGTKRDVTALYDPAIRG